MTAVDLEQRIKDGFAALKLTCDPRGHELLDALEEWMVFDHLALQRIMDAVPDEPDTFSRKVPDRFTDTPGLRLVGAYGCNPDESCGQDGAA